LSRWQIVMSLAFGLVSKKYKAILLKVYQVQQTTVKNTVFSTFGCANYVSTAGGYATVTKGLIQSEITPAA